jgi:hypothetical protein
MSNASEALMPLKPQFEEIDSQSWPQNQAPLRITVHPYRPPADNPTASDGIDDWISPAGVAGRTPFPDDWYIPGNEPADVHRPTDWFVPSGNNTQVTPELRPLATVADGSTLSSPTNNLATVRQDPLAAYRSLVPASHPSAPTWYPPAFQPPGSTPPDVPTISDGYDLLGAIRRLRPEVESPDVPAISDGYDLLGAIRRLRPQSESRDVPTFGDGYDLLGGIARLPAVSTPSDTPTFGVGQNPPADTPWTFLRPRFPSTGSSGWPFQASSGLRNRYPGDQLAGGQTGPSPIPPSPSASSSGPSTINENGTTPLGWLAAPPASVNTTSSAGAGRWIAGSGLADPDDNPILRFLGALNPIGRANAAEGEGGGLPPALLQMLLKGLINAATAERLAEQQKILEDAEAAKRELFEVAQGRASSRALGVALEASGVPRPPGYAAHHIAAGADERGEFARGVLKKFNIGINDASNGVFLPANQATQVIAGETIHSTLHTKKYYDAVNDALSGAITRQQAITALQTIRSALQSGDFP